MPQAIAINQALRQARLLIPLPDTHGKNVKNSSRQQFRGSVRFPLRKTKHFYLQRSKGCPDAQNAVPLLTDTSIFRPQAILRTIKWRLAGLTAQYWISALSKRTRGRCGGQEIGTARSKSDNESSTCDLCCDTQWNTDAKSGYESS